MANLDRVLGAIISNVARGRSQGDAAVVELAKMYLADDVLKSFPIPRMSLDEVVIELRVGISAMAQPGFTAEARQLLLERLDNTLHSLPERETALGDVMGREGAPARTLWQSQRASRLEAVARMLPEGSDINIERVSSAIGTLAKESVMTVLSDQRIVPTASRGASGLCSPLGLSTLRFSACPDFSPENLPPQEVRNRSLPEDASF